MPSLLIDAHQGRRSYGFKAALPRPSGWLIRYELIGREGGYPPILIRFRSPTLPESIILQTSRRQMCEGPLFRT